ncbi:MAG TPA: chromosomal replication initiator protein DnaA [Tepidisphaeraceae bacterium]|nr:chromosomal replication initiator protein DnaA [Tepidisphaeraceae bacterium]HEV8607213.1 chromosomal replication initiator protein DnaA [Tepidisphaeraceae bacterium]
MSCISAHDPQLERLADAIAQRVGQQRYSVWFTNSTRLDLKQDELEIAVPNDFISEWILRNFAKTIQDAAHEVLGCSLLVRFNVMPQLFVGHGEDGEIPADRPLTIAGARHRNGNGHINGNGHGNGRAHPIGNGNGPALAIAGGHGMLHSERRMRTELPPILQQLARQPISPPRLRHHLESFVVGAGNQLAYNAAVCVAEFPGVQYNPLFIHGSCGLGKTHLLQGLCRKYIENHPTKRWVYLTGEEFTNDFLTSLRQNKVDAFRRRVRDLDLLVIDDVHFMSGKKATLEEFLHTFNAIEAVGKQVVMASDHHPKMIEEFGESLINRFVSGMVVRIDPPNHATRCQILRGLAARAGLELSEEVIGWIARRVTQNVRELEGAVTRIGALVKLTGQVPDLTMVQSSLVDLERQMIAPVKPENILTAVCNYFGLEMKDLMSARRQRTISLARSLAMHLIRKTAKLSFPEIGMRMGKRNHSTVISACKRMERATGRNEVLLWSSSVGERKEEATELVQRLEELSRAMN